jgi:hypothetical protein
MTVVLTIMPPMFFVCVLARHGANAIPIAPPTNPIAPSSALSQALFSARLRAIAANIPITPPVAKPTTASSEMVRAQALKVSDKPISL